MEHKKTYYSQEIKTDNWKVFIEGPISPDVLATYEMHPELTAFRQPKEQQAALIEIAALPEGRIIIVRDEDMIIGYTTYLYPDPLESWSSGNMENLIELGAIEVAPSYRGGNIGKNMLKLAMLDDAMEDYIIITTEYYWHWDLKRTGLNVWKYRDMMEKMMNAGGLVYFATDDPEICSHPANCLMARIGSRINLIDVQKFDRLRFTNRFMF